MIDRRFAQVDVFSPQPGGGNPVAVVLDADGLDDAALQRFARWTNLSETTFVLPPSTGTADYRVRIFTPSRELPFAGHPTLGTCHAWLEARDDIVPGGRIVQECGAGLVELRRTADGLAFAAPPMRRFEPVAEDLLASVARGLGVEREEILDASWIDNGPGWLGVLLGSAERALALEPVYGGHEDVGVIALHEPGAREAIEVRGFFLQDRTMMEDPVTGSLNASVAQWLLANGRLTAPYVARQGTALGRTGRVHVSVDEAGAVWVAGATRTLVRGSLVL
jgi:PhzF family phenazine biosynthesis protein